MECIVQVDPSVVSGHRPSPLQHQNVAVRHRPPEQKLRHTTLLLLRTIHTARGHFDGDCGVVGLGCLTVVVVVGSGDVATEEAGLDDLSPGEAEAEEVLLGRRVPIIVLTPTQLKNNKNYNKFINKN